VPRAVCKTPSLHISDDAGFWSLVGHVYWSNTEHYQDEQTQYQQLATKLYTAVLSALGCKFLLPHTRGEQLMGLVRMLGPEQVVALESSALSNLLSVSRYVDRRAAIRQESVGLSDRDDDVRHGLTHSISAGLPGGAYGARRVSIPQGHDW
jgi:hypothetical protein